MGVDLLTLTPAFAAEYLKRRPCTNTPTTPSHLLLLSPPQKASWNASSGREERPPLSPSKQKPTCRNPNLPVCLISRHFAEPLLLICSPRWRRGRENMFLIAKPNGYAWVLSCLWELVLPQPSLSSPLRQPCQNSVWEWSQGKHEASQGFGE